MSKRSHNKIKANGPIRHLRESNMTACGRFISTWMVSSVDYNCGACKAVMKARVKVLNDNIYLSLNGDTYKLNTRNLKNISPRMIGLEYRVHKIHNGTFLTYLQLSEKYPHLTERKRHGKPQPKA